MDRKGITAVFNSEGKLDHMSQTTTLWNLKLDPSVFTDGEQGFEVVADLLRTFVDKKIWHIQINSVSADTMRAAQKEPEEGRDLMVRVAGYSAFFTDLKKPAQDMIIDRTEHKVG
jgi:formate C-acetyltransferase